MMNFVGTPYVKLGRDPSGFDCFGLVWYIYSTILGIDIDDEHRLFDNEEIMNGLESGRDRWESVDDPFDYDVCLMYRCGRPVHIGVYWKGRIMNSLENRGVCWLNIRSMNQLFTKIEFYRWP